MGHGGESQGGESRGSPVQRQLKAIIKKKKLRRLHFGAAVGGLWEYYLQKELGEREGKSKAREKPLKTQKMEEAPNPPKRRRSQSLCAGGKSRWLSRNRAQGPSPLLPSSHSLPPSWRCPGLFPAPLSQLVARLCFQACAEWWENLRFPSQASLDLNCSSATDDLGGGGSGGGGQGGRSEVGVNLQEHQFLHL